MGEALLLCPSASRTTPLRRLNGERGLEGGEGGGKVLTSPAVRRLAQEHGLDLSLVRGV